MNKKTDIVVFTPHHFTGAAVKHLIEKKSDAYYFSGYASTADELKNLMREISECILIYDADSRTYHPCDEILKNDSKEIALVALKSRDSAYAENSNETLLLAPYHWQDLLDALARASELLKKQKQNHLMKSSDNNIIGAAIQYISDNLQNELTLESIADYIHITPSYLSRLFKSTTGENIFGYISDARLDMAKNMLRNTNENINVIAANVGYDKINSFNQFFKRGCGMSPSAYRTKCKENPSEDD